MKKRAAVILDHHKICRWQLGALEAASESIDIVLILNCQNTNTNKRCLKNTLYYALNLYALRNSQTATQLLSSSDSKVVHFDALEDRAWQVLPSNVLIALKNENIEVVIKFGMGLLRMPSGDTMPPVLSYHHGDPSKYRGRPAGFYELLKGEKVIGIMIQSLTNDLDAGSIYAYAESKVTQYSYKKTAVEFYTHSVPLLNKAIKQLTSAQTIERCTCGKNYRLPSNHTVARMVLVMVNKLVRKLCYGLFFEKRWNVAVTKHCLALNQNDVITSCHFNSIPIDKRYNFYADPFFSHAGDVIRLEALDNKTGLGDILEINANNFSEQKCLFSGGHFSYPCSFVYQEEEYLLPEVASHSAQYFCSAKNTQDRYYLKGLEDKRIVDASFFIQDDTCYLFFGEDKTAQSALHLWVAASPFDVFQPHPMSPVVQTPSSARMGGKITQYSDKLLRFGQNNAGEYGESLAVMEITKISLEDYQEVALGTVKIDHFSGPHTINFSPDKSALLIDYYQDQFSILAGIRRIKSKLKKK